MSTPMDSVIDGPLRTPNGFLSLPLTESILVKLSDILANEIDQTVLLKDFPEKIEWLQDELRRMRCFLKDSGMEQDSDQAHRVDEVRKLAYDAEDLLTVFSLDRETKPNKFDAINLLDHKYKQWNSKRKIIQDVEAIKMKLLQINQRPQSTLPSSQNANQASPQQVPAYDRIEMRDIVGLENEANELLKQVINQQMKRSVLSIVGMGGIGKSTLAWKLLNHPDVKAVFESRAWVTITQKFDYRDVQVLVLSSSGTCQEEEFEKFCESLLDKRYLIVLDDVWGQPHQSVWDGRLFEAFPDVQNGSRIIVTTRMNDVAAYVGTQGTPFSMKHMDDKKSWELFCKKTSIGTNDKPLQDIGKKIVRRCGGLPLSIVTMGDKFGQVTKRRADWDKVYREMEGTIMTDKVLKKLEPSYQGLTPDLQNCFLFLSFFPVNYTISAKKLIQLWIAEGLITDQGEGMEAAAESYLDMLLEKNVVQPVEIRPDGYTKACRIDNSLREISVSKAKKVILLDIQEDDKFIPSSCSRHRAIHASMDRYFDSQDPTSQLRSLVFMVPNGKVSLPQLEFICKKFKLLRVLHLEGMLVGRIPDEVGDLQLLRYLNLRNTGIDKLQPSMSNLKKLLTLDIRDNMCVTNLDVLKDMKKLQNLYLPGYYEGLTASTLDGLCQLRTLKLVNIESQEFLESLAKITTLKTLRVQLEGQLTLDDFLEYAKDLVQLESLHMYPKFEISSLETDKFKLLTSLTKLYIKGGVRELPSLEQFPPNLMQLTLDGSGLIPFPIDELAKLPKLSILRLRNLYIKDEKLRFSAEGFPRLKYLELLHLWNLKELEIQGKDMEIEGEGASRRLEGEGAFLRWLKHLKIWRYMELLWSSKDSEIQENNLEIKGEGALRRLKHLKISNCTALDSLPTNMKQLTKLSRLDIDKMKETFERKIQEGGDHWDRIQHVGFIEYTNTLKSYDEI